VRGHEPQHLLFALRVLRELVVAQLSKVSVKYAKISQNMPKYGQISLNFSSYHAGFVERFHGVQLPPCMPSRQSS